MTKDLSVIITSLNDNEECRATVASIRATAGESVQIIVVDDNSQIPLTLEDSKVILIRNHERAGVAASRHLGAIHAASEYLLFIDSHMRFEPGWLDNALDRIRGRDMTMHCAQCIPLSKGNMDMAKAQGAYNGATILFYGKDAKSNQHQIFEGKWIPDREGDDYDIPCVMGACYFCPAEFFFHIGGLRLLRGWGSDEPYLSLKWWMAGGNVKMMKNVRIGHQFRDKSPYKTDSWIMAYNKMAAIQTILPYLDSSWLMSKFPKTPETILALNYIKQDANLILTDRAYNQRVSVRQLSWFLESFNIAPIS